MTARLVAANGSSPLSTHNTDRYALLLFWYASILNRVVMYKPGRLIDRRNTHFRCSWLRPRIPWSEGKGMKKEKPFDGLPQRIHGCCDSRICSGVLSDARRVEGAQRTSPSTVE